VDSHSTRHSIRSRVSRFVIRFGGGAREGPPSSEVYGPPTDAAAEEQRSSPRG
jgi:hypothetical protein